MSGPYLPELQTQYPTGLQTSLRGCPTNTSKSIHSLRELIVFPTKLNSFPHPRPQGTAEPSTHRRNFLLCQTSRGHQVILHLPSQYIFPLCPFLSSPTSCSSPVSHLLPRQLWPCPLQAIIHTAATVNTKQHCSNSLTAPYCLHDKIQAFSMVYKTPSSGPFIHLSGLSFPSGILHSPGRNSSQLQSCHVLRCKCA